MFRKKESEEDYFDKVLGEMPWGSGLFGFLQRRTPEFGDDLEKKDESPKHSHNKRM